MWEKIFSPTNRYCEMLRSRQTNVEWFSEMELSVPPEDLLISQRSVHDFYSFVQNHVMVWMSPQSFILTSETAQAVRLDDPEIQHVLTIGIPSSSLLTSNTNMGLSVYSSCYMQAIHACDFLLLFFAKSNVPQVSLYGGSIHTILPVSGQVLSHFIGQATLQKLELLHVELDPVVCNALSVRGETSPATATTSISSFELKLLHCSVRRTAEAEDAFVRGLQSIRGTTELAGCWIDTRILAETLSGNECHLKTLKLTAHNGGPIDPIARSIKRNTGLVELVVGSMYVSDQDFIVLCDSLESHATVTTLDLSEAQTGTATTTAMSQENMTFWLQAIVQLLQVNTVLQTITLPDHLMTADIYHQEITPRLETNRFRLRCLAIQDISDTDYRVCAKLSGRELTNLPLQLARRRHTPNLVFMLLLHNVQVLTAFRCSRKRKRHRADAY